MVKSGSLILLLFAFSFCCSQVPNNQISQRYQLSLDNLPLRSTTSNSSVEWDCINKTLTNKCLVYHNDQWFSFQVENTGDYYLNLTSQQCKKLQGLQVILIEGNPCEIKTYSILQCIPKISQEDTFVELRSIKSKTLYLLNIDGFLGDFCEFEIQLSSRPLGIPIQFNRSDSVETNLTRDKRMVVLNWKADSDLLQSIETFRIGRKKDKDAKSKWMHVSIEANAYGQSLSEYSLTDTLTEVGNYSYTILGLKKGNGYPLFLNEKKISYSGEWKSTAAPSQTHIYFKPDIKKSASLQVIVLDDDTNSVINYFTVTFDPKRNKNIGLPVSIPLEEGVKRFTIQIKNIKTQKFQKLYYKLDNEGRFRSYIKEQ